MKIRIRESQLIKLVKESFDRLIKESGDESYLDFNNNTYDDPSIAKAYVDGGDKAVKHIKSTHRGSLKSDYGNEIDLSGNK